MGHLGKLHTHYRRYLVGNPSSFFVHKQLADLYLSLWHIITTTFLTHIWLMEWMDFFKCFEGVDHAPFWVEHCLTKLYFLYLALLPFWVHFQRLHILGQRCQVLCLFRHFPFIFYILVLICMKLVLDTYRNLSFHFLFLQYLEDYYSNHLLYQGWLVESMILVVHDDDYIGLGRHSNYLSDSFSVEI